MHDEAKQPLTITLGEQVFRIRIAAEEEPRYRRVAAMANDALEDVLNSGVVGGPRALAMALFQLAVELDDAHEALRAIQRDRRRLGELVLRLDRVLSVDAGKI